MMQLFKKTWKAVRWAWKWSLCVTVPVGVLWLVWLFAVVGRYHSFGVRHDPVRGHSVMLKPLMSMEWHTLKRQLELQFQRAPKKPHLYGVHLWINEGNEDALNRRLPGSGREYVKGGLSYPDGSIENVSLRYRGDSAWHWALDKKSWRVKTKKSAPWNGMRRFNLIIPKSVAMVEMQLGLWLARELELLTPKSELSELWINGKNRGIHVLVEQLGEKFLRGRSRMPGDLYAGELIGPTDLVEFPSRVFAWPGAWEKVAINNHYADESRAPLVELCDRLQAAGGRANAGDLNGLVDWPSFATFAMFRSLIQSGHVDHYHNWRLYYDPWRNAFEPVVWDPMGWRGTWAPRAGEQPFAWPLFCELDEALVGDQRFRWAAARAWHAFFERDLDVKLLAEFDRLAESVRGAAKRDPAMSNAIEPVTEADMDRALPELRHRIAGYLDHFRKRTLQAPIAVTRTPVQSLGQNEFKLPIYVGGERPIRALVLRSALAWPAGTHLQWRDPSAVPAENGAAAVWTTIEDPELSITLQRPLLPGLKVVDNTAPNRSNGRIAMAYERVYELHVQVPASGALPDFSVHAVDLQGAEWLVPERELEANSPVPQAVEHGVLFATEPAAPVRWEGTVHLQGVTRIDGPLSIAAGTSILCDPGASVIVSGQVVALGTEAQPIQVIPADPELAPWGTFAIRTTAGNDSKLTHVKFRGGSGTRDALQEYSAMFSVHDADRVHVQHCSFERGSIVDDTVHVVYSEDLEFSDCHFSGAFSDALDLDGCSGSIERCVFDRSGNDAIDLMMSQIRVVDCHLLASGDKGVSVGEGSQLWLENAHIVRCAIGVEVKDGSVAWIEGGRFESNRLAWNAYKKNWQYGAGGHGFVHRASVRLHTEEIVDDSVVRADKASSWHLFDCELPAGFKPGKRVQSGSLRSGSFDLTRVNDSPFLGPLLQGL